MKSPTTCLPVDQIHALLSGDLPPAETACFEEHLAECSECRAAVEAAIGDEDWWDDARRSLAGGRLAGISAAVDSAHDIESATTTEQLLELLGPTDDPTMLGRIGSYEIVGILGRGGMGAVFKGYDPSLNRFVAIKVLQPHLAASGAARKRFAREAQAAAAVVDDHVMAIHGVSEWKSIPYFVMPYSRGVSLQKRLSNEGPLDLREILRIGMQAAKGLAAAHAQGLVHRDVKPANIFLDEGVERVQLMDFGLARAVDDASLTRTGVLAGTPQYMSPEQARAETVDARSDLFSLGAVLYAMCTGHAPFRAESSHAVLRLITDRHPRPIREVNPDISEWLCSIIDKLMSKQPEDRFESAAQVAVLLEACLAHVQEPTRVSLPVELNKLRSASSPRRLSWKGVLLMLGAIGTILLGTVVLSATSPPDISGHWQGDGWGEVVLEQTDGKGKSYSGKFAATEATGAGKLTLKWSRIEQRFNGTWTDDRGSGKLSIRLDGDDLHGAVTSERTASGENARPKLADLHWRRSPIGNDLATPATEDKGRRSQPEDEPVAGIPDAVRPLYDRLQGTWVITKAVEEGVDDLGTFDDRSGLIVIDGSLLTVRGKNQGRSFEVGMLLTFLDPGSPQPVDILINPNDTESPCPVPGIIECEGDRFRFCCRSDCNAGAENRPKVFSGSGQYIWLYEARRMSPTSSAGADSHLKSRGASRSSSRPLAAVVGEFNERQQQHPIGKSQPPLTVDEVVASIRAAKHDPYSGTEFDEETTSAHSALREIGRTGIVPQGWKLEVETEHRFDGQDVNLTMWNVRLMYPTDDGHFDHPIRIQPLDYFPKPTPDQLRELLNHVADTTTRVPLSHWTDYGRIATRPEMPTIPDRRSPSHNEVLAGLLYYYSQHEDDLDDAVREELELIIGTHAISKGAAIEFGGAHIADHIEYVDADVVLLIDSPTGRTGLALNQHWISSTPAPEANGDRIAWGPTALDGLQFGVRLDAAGDLNEEFGNAFRPTFYFRNPTGNTAATFEPTIAHFDVDAWNATGTQLPTRVSGIASHAGGYLGVLNVEGSTRIERPGSPLFFTILSQEEFQAPDAFDDWNKAPASEPVIAIGTHPLFANRRAEDVLPTTLRLRFHLHHPGSRELPKLMSGEVIVTLDAEGQAQIAGPTVDSQGPLTFQAENLEGTRGQTAGSQQVREALVTVSFRGEIDHATVSSSCLGWVIDDAGHILIPSYALPVCDEEQIELRYTTGACCSAKRVRSLGQLTLLKSDQVCKTPSITLDGKVSVAQGDSVTAMLNGTDIVSGTVTNTRKTFAVSEMAGVTVSPPLRFQDVITTDIKPDDASLGGAPLLTKNGEIAGMFILLQEGESPVIPVSELQFACEQFSPQHPRYIFRPSFVPQVMAVSADGDLIAVANGWPDHPVANDWSQRVEVIDVASGQRIADLTLTTPEEDAVLDRGGTSPQSVVTALAFTRQGKLAVGTVRGQVKLFDPRTGVLLNSLDDRQGKQAAGTPQHLMAFPRAMGSIDQLVSSPFEEWLLVVGDSLTDEPLPHGDGVRNLPERTTGAGRLQVWDLTTGRLTDDLPGHSHVKAASWSPIDDYIASAGQWMNERDGGTGVKLWSVESGLHERRIAVEANGGTCGVDFSLDGKSLVIMSRSFDPSQRDDPGITFVTVVATASGVIRWQRAFPGRSGLAQFTPDGIDVIYIREGHEVNVLDAESGIEQDRYFIDGGPGGAHWSDFQILGDGRWVAAGKDDHGEPLLMVEVSEPPAKEQKPANAAADSMSESTAADVPRADQDLQRFTFPWPVGQISRADAASFADQYATAKHLKIVGCYASIKDNTLVVWGPRAAEAAIQKELAIREIETQGLEGPSLDELEKELKSQYTQLVCELTQLQLNALHAADDQREELNARIQVIEKEARAIEARLQVVHQSMQRLKTLTPQTPRGNAPPATDTDTSNAAPAEVNPAEEESWVPIIFANDAATQNYKAGDRVNVYLLVEGEEKPAAGETPFLENVEIQSIRPLTPAEEQEINQSGQIIVLKTTSQSDARRTRYDIIAQEIRKKGGIRFHIEPVVAATSNDTEPPASSIKPGPSTDSRTVPILVSDDDLQGHTFKAGDHVNVYLLAKGEVEPKADEIPVLQYVEVLSAQPLTATEEDRVRWSGKVIVVQIADDEDAILDQGGELLQELYRQGKVRFYVMPVEPVDEEELARLQGTWRIDVYQDYDLDLLSENFNLNVPLEDQQRVYELRIEDRLLQVRVIVEGESAVEYSARIARLGSGEIDLEFMPNDEERKQGIGIYKINEKRLQICWRDPAVDPKLQERPQVLASGGTVGFLDCSRDPVQTTDGVGPRIGSETE